MNPFDPDAICVKCEYDDIGAIYFCPTEKTRTGEHMVQPQYRVEHIKRKCMRCGYTWPEAPLDSVPDEDAASPDEDVLQEADG